jgi:signal transduction histidine kinase
MNQVGFPADHEAALQAISRIAAVPTILDVVCRSTGMGFAAVARVTEERWIACSVQDGIQFGLQPGGELKVETTICHEVRQHREPVVINDVAKDPAYRGHPTPALYGFQSYISMPITMPDGTFFGTLCAIDPKPHKLNTPEIIGSFRLFAELIAFHLDANLRITRSEVLLARERHIAELREQFIAVLGHDLRNPLASIGAGAGMLLRHPERTADIVRRIDRSVSRMAGLIDNVLDLARGRLGGGLTLSRDTEPLEPALAQVISELQSTHPDRAIDVRLALEQPVNCDRARVAQLLSNVLGNALTYGAPSEPIRVSASARGGVFELAVSNAGEPIPAAALEHLFQPFFRGPHSSGSDSQGGLGLGLYIASEIARAHDGRLTVSSTPAQTCFTFQMPAAA